MKTRMNRFDWFALIWRAGLLAIVAIIMTPRLGAWTTSTKFNHLRVRSLTIVGQDETKAWTVHVDALGNLRFRSSADECLGDYTCPRAIFDALYKERITSGQLGVQKRRIEVVPKYQEQPKGWIR